MHVKNYGRKAFVEYETRDQGSNIYIYTRDIVPEINDSGSMCITDLLQNKYLAYFNPN